MYRLFCMLPLAALLLCLFGAAGCGGGDDDELGSGSELNPKDTVPEIEVYAVDFRYRTTFHNNPWGYSQLPYNSDPALPLLRTASSSLDLAIPRLSRQELVDALLQLAQAGVAVRIVTELDSYQDAAQKAFFDQLEAGPTTNIQIRTDTDALPRQMGCRFFIIDKLQVVCSSFPFESSEYDQSMGDVILIRDPDVAQSAFSVVFDDMFNGRFGREKYPAIQHNFMLGQGDAALEVYFLPNDDFTTLMTRELNLANVVLVSQQQWGDTALAGSLGTWLASTIPPNSLFGQRVLGVMINDTSEDPLSVTDANPNQDIWERSVDEYFTTLLSNPEEGGQTILTGMPVPHYDGLFYYGFPLGRDIYGALPYDHSYALDTVMGHNFVIFEQAQFHLNSDVPTGGIQGLRPLFNNWQTLDSAVLWTDASFSTSSLSIDDQVVLILRGEPLTNYYVGLEPFIGTPPLTDLEGVGLVEQLFAMMPMASNAEAPLARTLNGLSCGIVVGTIPNFRENVRLLNDDGTSTEIGMDVTFRIEGEYYFGGTYPALDLAADSPLYGNPNIPRESTNPVAYVLANFVDPVTPPGAEDPLDHFDRNERSNPDKRFALYVPAGDVTIHCIALDLEGNPVSADQWTQRNVYVGPGGVVEVSLNVVGPQAQTTTGGGGTGGGT